MILLTGGSACGKSSYAESLCLRFDGPRHYIAAMRPYGEGSAEKIERQKPFANTENENDQHTEGGGEKRGGGDIDQGV